MDASVNAGPGARILAMWRRCRTLPLGTTLFAWALGAQVPYSASIRPRVLELAPGHARVAIADRRGLRNHLGSIHAVALANLGELTSGLAMTTAMPPGTRAIVTALTTEYVKKARGRIVAASDVTLPPLAAETELEVAAELCDAEGAVVARTTARWRIGPA